MKHLSSGYFRCLVAALLLGCSAQGGGTQTVCTVGFSQICLCASGASGTQTCMADMSFGQCVCAGTDGGTDGGTDLGGFDLAIPTDLGPLADRSVAPDVVDVTNPQDRPIVMDTGSRDTGIRDSGPGGVCPASCGFNSDCDPCWGPGETRVGTYCCTTGLCIYSTGMCGASLPEGGVIEDPAMGETGVPDAAGFDIGG